MVIRTTDSHLRIYTETVWLTVGLRGSKRFIRNLPYAFGFNLLAQIKGIAGSLKIALSFESNDRL